MIDIYELALLEAKYILSNIRESDEKLNEAIVLKTALKDHNKSKEMIDDIIKSAVYFSSITDINRYLIIKETKIKNVLLSMTPEERIKLDKNTDLQKEKFLEIIKNDTD